MVTFIPLMKDNEYRADNPACIAVIQEGWERRLAEAYAFLIAKGAIRKQGLNVWEALGSFFEGDLLMPQFTPRWLQICFDYANEYIQA